VVERRQPGAPEARCGGNIVMRGARRTPKRAEVWKYTSAGVPPPFFFRFLVVIAGLDPAIHAEVALARCFPPALVRRRRSANGYVRW